MHKRRPGGLSKRLLLEAAEEAGTPPPPEDSWAGRAGIEAELHEWLAARDAGQHTAAVVQAMVDAGASAAEWKPSLERMSQDEAQLRQFIAAVERMSRRAAVGE